MGPEYAEIFEAHVWHLLKEAYQGQYPELLKRYIDDNFGATTMSEGDLLKFIEFADSFNPSLRYTFNIGKCVEMLDTIIEVKEGKLVPKIYYKDTDSHSYLTYTSDHPPRCKDSIPYSQMLRLRRVCKEEDVYDQESKRMISFFTNRGYPESIPVRARELVKQKKRQEIISDRQKDGNDSKRLTFPLKH